MVLLNLLRIVANSSGNKSDSVNTMIRASRKNFKLFSPTKSMDDRSAVGHQRGVIHR